MAENQELPWLTKVAPAKVDLGKGKRMILPKGRYDAKYRITVPLDQQGMFCVAPHIKLTEEGGKKVCFGSTV
jgi:hypothetical protein